MAPISEQFKLSLAILMLKPHKYIPMYCNKVPTGLLALFQDYKHLFLILYAYIFALSAYSGDGEHRFRFYREHLNSTHWVHDIFNLSVHDGQF